jgi:uncharacterized protein (DUF58 family)
MQPSPPAPERVVQRLDWQVVRRLDGLLQGEYGTLFRGAGMDLANLREYQPGDDIRAIDWNVTARTDVTHVRDFHEERELTCWFLLDLSPSVDFGTEADGRLKRTVLIDFVTTLARVLTRRGNRVAAICYGSGVQRTIPVASGRLAVLRLVDELQRQPMHAGAPATDLGDLLDTALKVIRRRSLVVIVSDFISEPGWESRLHLLNQRHDLLAVRLTDPRERILPDVGLVVVSDAETGEQLEIDTSDRGFRERFERAAAERETAVNRSLATAGVQVASLSTEDDLVRAIVRMAGERRRRARHTR